MLVKLVPPVTDPYVYKMQTKEKLKYLQKMNLIRDRQTELHVSKVFRACTCLFLICGNIVSVMPQSKGVIIRKAGKKHKL